MKIKIDPYKTRFECELLKYLKNSYFFKKLGILSITSKGSIMYEINIGIKPIPKTSRNVEIIIKKHVAMARKLYSLPRR